jgi:hypothetical protein
VNQYFATTKEISMQTSAREHLCNITIYFKTPGPTNMEGQLTGPFIALGKKNKYCDNLS